MTQADLFAGDPGEAQVAPAAPGWTGHPGLYGTSRNGRWTNPALPGVNVRHCGHFTALRPYYVQSPDGAVSQRKFHALAECQAAAIKNGAKSAIEIE